ncbi:18989_t:CDS:2, partial [Gigaspora rosea]
ISNVSSDNMCIPTYSTLESQKTNISELTSNLLFSTLSSLLRNNDELDLELGDEVNELELELGGKMNELELEHGKGTNELELEPREGTNDSDDQDSEQEEISEIENEIPEIELSDGIIKGLRLLYVKNKYTLSDRAFKKIMEIFGLSNISLYRLQKIFSDMVPIEPTFVDMCWNSCCTFNGENSSCEMCPICGEPRYLLGKVPKKAQKSAAYFSIIDSLKMQYKDLARTKTP